MVFCDFIEIQTSKMAEPRWRLCERNDLMDKLYDVIFVNIIQNTLGRTIFPPSFIVIVITECV